jgi:hypothetical protein
METGIEIMSLIVITKRFRAELSAFCLLRVEGR